MNSEKINKNISLVLMGAGSSNRLRNNETLMPHKQWIRIGQDPLWKVVLEKFKKIYKFENIVLTAQSDCVAYMSSYCDERVISGGESRANSLRNALEHINTQYVMVSDVARWDLDCNVMLNLIDSIKDDEFDCVAPYIPVSDTIFSQENGFLDREKIKLIQTPQLCKTKTIKSAMQFGDFSDESSAISAYGGKIKFINGSKALHKLTYKDDLLELQKLGTASKKTFNGAGIDIHKFQSGKKMFLCGIEIECDFGFDAHSDGDVALHSLCDAILGAIGGGDIGEWFPDNDQKYKDANSSILTEKIVSFANDVGYEISNTDITIIAQIPKITPYKSKMKEKVAKLLKIDKNLVNIKATTSENIGFVGRGEGVCVMANVGVNFIDWSKKS